MQIVREAMAKSLMWPGAGTHKNREKSRSIEKSKKTQPRSCRLARALEVEVAVTTRWAPNLQILSHREIGHNGDAVLLQVSLWTNPWRVLSKTPSHI